MPLAQDRWEPMKHLAARWHRPLTQDDGFPLSEIREAESRLYIQLPLALQEWYLLAGNRQDLNAAQNYLLSPADLEISDEYLVFYMENQAVVCWGIQLSDLGTPDPPVYLDNDFSVPTGSTPHAWILENNTLSEFLLQMTILHTLIQMNPSVEDFYGCAEIDPSKGELIATKFPRLELPPWHWPAYPTHFFGNDEVLLMVDGAMWLWVTARSAPAFRELVEHIPVTWIHCEGPSL